MNNQKQAEKDYLSGMKYKDIADKYQVSINTVKSWKKRYGWQRTPNKKGAHKVTKRVHTKPKKGAHKIVDQLETNGQLNEKQKLFCLYYLQRFNATWAYQKAYGVPWNTANVNGPRLLVNASVRAELDNLRMIREQTEAIKADDIVRELQRQAFANIGDYVEAKRVKHLRWMKHYVKQGPYINSSGKHYELLPYIDPETGKQAFYYENEVNFTNKGDTSLLKTLRLDKGEALVETNDKVKALTELLKRYPVPTVMQSAQLRKANAEADIAETKAKEIQKVNQHDDSTIVVDDLEDTDNDGED